jgi:predicted nucleic acid-binding protein
MMVVDANVAAKWYLPEPDSDKALALLGTPHQLIAPSLIKMDVCSAITRRVRGKEITPSEAKEHCREWFADLRRCGAACGRGNHPAAGHRAVG